MKKNTSYLISLVYTYVVSDTFIRSPPHRQKNRSDHRYLCLLLYLNFVQNIILTILKGNRTCVISLFISS